MRRLVPKLIRLLFLVLAGASVVFLLTDLSTTNETPRTLWKNQLCLLAAATMTAFLDLDQTGRQVKKLSTEGRLPDWVMAQAEKNQSRAGKPLFLGLFAFILVDFARGHGLIANNLYVGFKSFDMAIQVGAFFGGYVILKAQTRLIKDVEGWVKKPDEFLAGSEV